MIDVQTVILTGFANSIGTISALELFHWIKERRLHKKPLKYIDDIVNIFGYEKVK